MSISLKLENHYPEKMPSRHWSARSAVAVVLDSDTFSDASVLMIKRAEHKDDPWSGHMAFPGGRKEKSDKAIIDTATREMHEELGFDITAATNSALIGRLSDVETHRKLMPKPMVVSPFVFLINKRPKLQPNYEVAEAVWIPLAFFQDANNAKQIEMRRDDLSKKFLCYEYDGKVIWGLSLSILLNLIKKITP